MKEVLEKITSYNLFNYLFPGFLFAVALDELTMYSITQENLIVGVFVYYFAGLVISRFGSLVIEPFLKKISFLKFGEYSSHVSASRKDSAIETFSETNNMYRTFSAMLILVILLQIYEFIELKFSILSKWNPYILIITLLTIFLFSYKKQTEYIRKRIMTKDMLEKEKTNL